MSAKGTNVGKASPAAKPALLGIMGALALALSFLESLLPPMPYMPPGTKPGLSNVAVLFTAHALGWKEAFAVALLKAAFAGATRGVTAGLLSLAGGVLSTAALCLLLRQEKLGLIGVCVICAVCHNSGQLAAACLLTGTARLFAAVPLLLLFSLAAGIVTGCISRSVLPALTKIRLKM
ncbi:MAG: Gx transporter family protein [Oscillospiraceae bacterium]|nr:Gx transporter family protein [Oscillospiraceae bacterium]